MKIKKKFQGSLPENAILNTASNSEIDTYSCKYINDISVVVSSTEPTGEDRKKVWLQKGNLFNKETATEGYYIGSNGTPQALSTTFYSDFIKLEVGNYYTKNTTSQGDIINYDENKNYVGRFNSSGTFKAEYPYIRINGFITDIDNTAVEQNGQVMYVLNDNGMYEEFMKKEENSTYSYSYKGLTINSIKNGNIVNLTINGSLTEVLSKNTFYDIDIHREITPKIELNDAIYTSSNIGAMIRIATNNKIRIYPWEEFSRGLGIRYTLTYLV